MIRIKYSPLQIPPRSDPVPFSSLFPAFLSGPAAQSKAKVHPVVGDYRGTGVAVSSTRAKLDQPHLAEILQIFAHVLWLSLHQGSQLSYRLGVFVSYDPQQFEPLRGETLPEGRQVGKVKRFFRRNLPFVFCPAKDLSQLLLVFFPTLNAYFDTFYFHSSPRKTASTSVTKSSQSCSGVVKRYGSSRPRTCRW